MTTLPNLFRSLLLTSIFSFLAPVSLIVVLLAGSAAIGHTPLDALGSNSSFDQIVQFLKVFGNGSLWRGITVIGLVGSLVGVLFDTYSFYQSQQWRSHRH
jgi:hypothetical protein